MSHTKKRREVWNSDKISGKLFTSFVFQPNDTQVHDLEARGGRIDDAATAAASDQAPVLDRGRPHHYSKQAGTVRPHDHLNKPPAVIRSLRLS